RQLMAGALVAPDPLDLDVVALLIEAHAARARDWMKRVLVEFAAGDHRDRLVEQAGQAADHPRLRLSALAEEDDVLATQDRVLELRHHRLFVAEDAVEDWPALADARDQILAPLLLDRLHVVAGLFQFTERCWFSSGRHRVMLLSRGR